jgi:DNA-binding transcriptional LysR family regulator
MLDLLRYFVAIATHGTLTSAAHHSGISQPALTTALHRLEDALDTKLFVRGRQGAVLTASGKALLPHAERALGAVQSGLRAVQEIEGLERGEIRIHAGATVCAYVLPAFIAAYRKKHSAIRFTVSESGTDAALLAVDRGDADFAMVVSRTGEALMVDKLVLIRSHALKSDAEQAPLIAFHEGGSTRAASDKAFPHKEIAMELSGVGAVLANVEAGIGVALVSSLAAQRGLARGTFVEVPMRTPIERTLRLVHRGPKALSPAAASFRRMLLEARRKTNANALPSAR